MALNRFFFSHKNWYGYVIFFTNLLIPVFLGCWSWKNSSLSSYHGATLIGAGIFVISILVYVFLSMREYRSCAKLLPEVKSYFLIFVKGISCTIASANLFLISGLVFVLNGSNGSNGSAAMYVGYVFGGLSLPLGIVSNIYLSGFEFKVGGIVFKSKFGTTLIPVVNKDIGIRKTAFSKTKR